MGRWAQLASMKADSQGPALYWQWRGHASHVSQIKQVPLNYAGRLCRRVEQMDALSLQRAAQDLQLHGQEPLHLEDGVLRPAASHGALPHLSHHVPIRLQQDQHGLRPLPA